MPTFGDAIITILAEIIRSTVGTALVITKNVALLFQIIGANASSASPLAMAAASAILAIVLFALFKFFKGEAKAMLVAMIILTGLLLSALLLR